MKSSYILKGASGISNLVRICKGVSLKFGKEYKKWEKNSDIAHITHIYMSNPMRFLV